MEPSQNKFLDRVFTILLHQCSLLDDSLDSAHLAPTCERHTLSGMGSEHLHIDITPIHYSNIRAPAFNFEKAHWDEFQKAVKVPHQEELILVTSYRLLKSNPFQLQGTSSKILIVTTSCNAKKGTHVTSYTLLLHEKIATFIFKTLLI